ncbi:hypothetical protein [Streptomyces sp. NPDC058872]|uniref:hypothetical protein n=1 Tax=Streptomyces sp. NPDC058872 TaxID=3346661 RepID=UPI0036CF1C52
MRELRGVVTQMLGCRAQGVAGVVEMLLEDAPDVIRRGGALGGGVPDVLVEEAESLDYLAEMGEGGAEGDRASGEGGGAGAFGVTVRRRYLGFVPVAGRQLLAGLDQVVGDVDDHAFDGRTDVVAPT